MSNTVVTFPMALCSQHDLGCSIAVMGNAQKRQTAGSGDGWWLASGNPLPKTVGHHLPKMAGNRLLKTTGNRLLKTVGTVLLKVSGYISLKDDKEALAFYEAHRVEIDASFQADSELEPAHG